VKYQTFKIIVDSLSREADAYVYLPSNYHESNKRYPVLYMHDAQNLFDDQTATYKNSWKIIEAYQKDETLPELIVCGINCAEGQSRLDEYSPFVDQELQQYYSDMVNRDVGGLGDAYLDFLSKDFKELIDSKYRTNPSQEVTGICGSSMGGVISAYAAGKYSDIYSRVGTISTAYFFAKDQMYNYLETADLSKVKTWYSDVGDSEYSGSTDTREIYTKLGEKFDQLLKDKLVNANYLYKIIEKGTHNETSWSTRFDEIIKFMYSDLVKEK